MAITIMKNKIMVCLGIILILSILLINVCDCKKNTKITNINTRTNGDSKTNRITKNNYSMKNLNKINKQKPHVKELEKQSSGGAASIAAQTKEVTGAEFLRLIIMRLIYGIATQMGLEERLAGVFNGAFVPPNADDDYIDGFDFGEDLDGGFGLFEEF